MNVKKAKKLRRLIFGDKAFKGQREYVAVMFDKLAKRTELPDGNIHMYTPFTILLKPDTPWANYRAVKRAWAGGTV